MRIAWKPLGWGVFSLLAVVIVFGALTLRHWWAEALERNGIETLEWQGLNLSFSGVSVQALTLTQSQPARTIVLHAKALTLGWRLPDWQGFSEVAWQPQLTELTAEHLKLNWHTTPDKQPEAEPSQPGQWPPDLPAWLPSEINIQHVEAALPWLGDISGRVDVTLKTRHGRLYPDTLRAELELNHPAAWVSKVPEPIRPESLSLSIRPGKASASLSPGIPVTETATEPTLLPLNVALRSRGRDSASADISIDSHLAVALGPPWAVQLGSTQVSAGLPELGAAGWLLTKPSVQMNMTGWMGATGAALTFGEPAVLEADTLQPASGSAAANGQTMRLNGFRANLANTTLKASYNLKEGQLDQLDLSGPVGVSAKQVQHPQLLPQRWHFTGKLDSNLTRTDISGMLAAKSGTSINLVLKAPYNGLLAIDASMQMNGEQGAEALSRTLTAWPSLLTVSGGKLSANVAYRKPTDGTAQWSGDLSFADWSGTYDRTAWSDINGAAEVLLNNGRFSLRTPGLSVGTVNPGLSVGPVHLAGSYEAPLDHLAAGQLTLQRADSRALGGALRIQPGTWDFAQAPVTLPVKLDKLSLAHLLKLYPAEGLAGTGTLSGSVPLQVDPATGISIKQGHINALKPGGRLQITAERLKALASQNASMKLVAQALENFQYSVLNSGITYDEDGTLVLNLHLKGNNPNVAKGQPVVLNVNLEENIPALLTSLQLSGRVSDAVAERIRKMLQKREHSSDELLE
jgi:hypothetical protein